MLNMRFHLVLSLTFLIRFTMATVFVDQDERTCKGAVTVIKCTTTTGTGFLSWRNSQGMSYSFDNAASAGDTGTLESTKIILEKVEPVSNAVVYTSTASGKNMINNTTIKCTDGGVLESIDIIVESPSSLSWAHSACNFSQGSVRLSWNDPAVAPECCDHYTVHLSTGWVNVTDTSVTVPIGDEAISATVYCMDDGGEMLTKTEGMTVNPRNTIERITIEPLNISCDGNITYQISWITNVSDQDVCTPPITMSTITCTTPSTHQSSNNTRSMACSVPANEPITATVTITNAAGLTVLKSANSVVLAQVCSHIKTDSSNTLSPVPSGELEIVDQSQPATIAAVILGLVILLIIAVISALTIMFLVKTLPRQTKIRSDGVTLTKTKETNMT